VANLFLQNDRKGLTTGIGFSFTKLNVTLNYADQKTNINNPLEDMLHQRKVDASVSYNLSASWRLGADFSLDNLDYDSSTGKVTSNSDMQTTNINASVGFMSGTTSVNLTLGKRDSKNFSSDISASLNISFALGTFFSLSPTLSYQKQDNKATAEEMSVYSLYLQSTMNFIQNWLSLATNFSYSSTESKSYDNKSLSLNSNLNLNLATLFKQKINPMLSARCQYQKTSNSGTSSDNLSFWLQLDISF
jgi:hypothetical protein